MIVIVYFFEFLTDLFAFAADIDDSVRWTLADHCADWHSGEDSTLLLLAAHVGKCARILTNGVDACLRRRTLRVFGTLWFWCRIFTRI